MKPTQFTLLDPNKEKWGLLKPVTVTDTFEGQTSNLHDRGLYSTEIFGRVGTPERDTTESYIDIKLPVFHPTYFKTLVNLKSLYGEIIKGRAYAKWDEVEKDFIKSNLVEGETGYAFFMSHFGELDPKENQSFRRDKSIKFKNEFQPIAQTSKVITIPAGIRDIEIAPNGMVTENEINDLYRKLLFRSRSLNMDKPNTEDPIYDNTRWGLQESFNQIAQFLFDMMEGKRGFMQRKVGRRGVFYATRNVITSRKVSIEDSDKDQTNDPNSVIIGIYQALLAYSPLSIFALNKGFLADVFTPGINMARVVNKKTLESEYVQVDPTVVDRWTSPDGLNRLFNGFSNPQLRNKDITINGEDKGQYHLGLMYDDGETIMLLHDINELPDGFDRKHVRPLTYMQLFYCECVPYIETKLGQLTRYPVEGMGSIFPAKVFVKPTNDTSTPRKRIDQNGDVINQYHFFPGWSEIPSYFDGMSISNTRLEGSGGDQQKGPDRVKVLFMFLSELLGLPQKLFTFI